MPPGKAEMIKTTFRGVNAIFGVVPRIMHIWVQFIKFWKDHGIVRNSASDYKGISTESPLFTIRTVTILSIFSMSPEEHDLPHVMKKTSKLKPIRMTSSSNAEK